ncbi:hypothetical protein KVF10_02850 [Helicobacter pylori]|nr:hypothetical protein KVF10_02850 [Helicobacter pylori]
MRRAKNQQKEKDKTPQKKALFKDYRFPLTKKAKKDFASNPPKIQPKD